MTKPKTRTYTKPFDEFNLRWQVIGLIRDVLTVQELLDLSEALGVHKYLLLQALNNRPMDDDELRILQNAIWSSTAYCWVGGALFRKITGNVDVTITPPGGEAYEKHVSVDVGKLNNEYGGDLHQYILDEVVPQYEWEIKE